MICSRQLVEFCSVSQSQTSMQTRSSSSARTLCMRRPTGLAGRQTWLYLAWKRSKAQVKLGKTTYWRRRSSIFQEKLCKWVSRVATLPRLVVLARRKPPLEMPKRLVVHPVRHAPYSSSSRQRRYETSSPQVELAWRESQSSLFHGCTQHPSLAQSASSIQSRGGRQVACRPVILDSWYYHSLIRPRANKCFRIQVHLVRMCCWEKKQSKNLIEKTYSWTCCTTAMTCQGPRIHLSGPATWKWALLGTTLRKKKRRRGNEERAWQKERNKRWKWEMTENAQVDKENNWALLHGHFKVDCNVKSAVVVRLCLPFNWSITTASLPWSTKNSKTAVTGVFSCPVNVERDVEDGC